jgi:hypothetical protein
LTASSVDQLNQNVTILGNLQVFGTASYTYVSASQLDVGTNFISVNVAEPAQRFGGLRVYDSGSLSHQATASLAWDSTNNHWVYQNASGSTYSGGMLMSGPRNTGSLGDEPSLTRWRVARSDGGDHLNDTQIFSSASVHQITGSLTVSDYLIVPTSINSQDRQLLDNDGNPSITWGSRKLKTPIGYEIDYNSDRVFESDTFLSDNISETILEDFATNGDGDWYAGHVIQGQIVNDTGVVCKAVGQTDWYRPRLDRASEAGTLLGIRINSTSVLLQGDIVVNDIDSGIGFYVLDGGFTMGPGYKVYLNSSGMSLEVPTSGYVRELGYIYYASTGDGNQFIMRFNPSNDYYLLS